MITVLIQILAASVSIAAVIAMHPVAPRRVFAVMRRAAASRNDRSW